jgi:hypothetical protein
MKGQGKVKGILVEGAFNSWSPVSYGAMGRWMLEEAAANEFVHAAPLVSRRRR